MTQKKLFITAGHSIFNGKGTGAHGVNGFDEAVEARKLVNAIIAHQKKWYGIDAYTDLDTDSLQRVVNKQIALIDKNFICLDIHFNSSSNQSATGTEVIIDDTYTAEEKYLAGKIAAANSKALFLPMRYGKLRIPGVKLESETPHKRLAMLSGPTKGINLLAEVCFISNPKDVAKYRTNFNDVVKNNSDVLGNYIKYGI